MQDVKSVVKSGARISVNGTPHTLVATMQKRFIKSNVWTDQGVTQGGLYCQNVGFNKSILQRGYELRSLILVLSRYISTVVSTSVPGCAPLVFA